MAFFVVYGTLLHQDFFIRKYLKTQFRKYRVDLVNCEIKRTFNTIFISAVVFNANVNANFQFKPFLFLRSYYFLKHIFYLEMPHFIKAIKTFFKATRVIFNFQIISKQKPNFKTVALTANPVLLGNYFIRRYSRMNSFRHILKSFRGLYGSLRLERFNLKGLKIRVAGPTRAPRTRRSQIIKKLYFGTTPVQTFSSLILYVARTRALSEGVVTMRAWLYKKTAQEEALKNKYVFFFCNKLMLSRKNLIRIFKTKKRKHKNKRKLWSLTFTKSTQLQKKAKSVPFFFDFNWVRRKVVGFLPFFWQSDMFFDKELQQAKFTVQKTKASLSPPPYLKKFSQKNLKK